MPTSSNNNLPAYIRLRKTNSEKSLPSLKNEIQQTENEIAELQRLLAREQASTVLHNQGLLYAWALTRLQARRELEHLAQQPWLEEAAFSSDGQTFRLAARLQRELGLLVLDIRAPQVPAVSILQPQEASRQITPLFQAVLDGLFADGCLVEIVMSCVQRFGLELGQADRPPQILTEVEPGYFRQRAGWLSQRTDPPGLIDVKTIIEHLNFLFRELSVLDQYVKEFTLQSADPQHCLAIEKASEQEFKILSALPEILSLTVIEQRAEFETQEIYIKNILIGRFRVTMDIEPSSMLIVNLTQPRFENGIRFDHPHVRQGIPCFGNVQSAVSEMLASRDLPRLVPLTLDFLKSYNPASPFMQLEKWIF